jgi:hypothetical protein
VSSVGGTASHRRPSPEADRLDTGDSVESSVCSGAIVTGPAGDGVRGCVSGPKDVLATTALESIFAAAAGDPVPVCAATYVVRSRASFQPVGAAAAAQRIVTASAAHTIVVSSA